MSDHGTTSVLDADADADRDAVPLAHQFDDPDQQHQSAVLGMWAFLATEVMFFGGILTAYTIYRATFPAEFAAGSQELSPALGGLNTLVLLGSSLAVALAVRSSQLRQRRTTVGLLLITIVLGLGFLGIKGYEWSHEFSHHLAPGASFHYEGHPEDVGTDLGAPGPTAGLEVTSTETAAPPGQPGVRSVQSPSLEHDLNPRHIEMFFVFYFFLTGIHAFHMIVGLAILGILAYTIGRKKVPATGERPVEITGLYWHFVDIVWVFLYPLLYLIEVKKL